MQEYWSDYIDTVILIYYVLYVNNSLILSHKLSVRRKNYLKK